MRWNRLEFYWYSFVSAAAIEISTIMTSGCCRRLHVWIDICFKSRCTNTYEQSIMTAHSLEAFIQNTHWIQLGGMPNAQQQPLNAIENRTVTQLNGWSVSIITYSTGDRKNSDGDDWTKLSILFCHVFLGAVCWALHFLFVFTNKTTKYVNFFTSA